MQTFKFDLQPANAVNVEAAIGKLLADGDVHPGEGETVFGAALAQVCQGYVNPPPPPAPSSTGRPSPSAAHR
jgi:hypothetical protein